MIPLMPSPGSPKTVSTPQSASRSISASDAIRAIVPSVSHWTVPICPSRKRPNVAPEGETAVENREPGKLALPGPQLGRLRGGYRLLLLVLRRLGGDAVVNRQGFSGDPVPRVPGPHPVNRCHPVRLDLHGVREQLPDPLGQQGRPVRRD